MPRDETRTRALWLSLRGITPRFRDVMRELREFEREHAETRLRGADILYRAESDTALLRICIDADRASESFVNRLRGHSQRMDASLVDIGTLDPEIRQPFSEAYLSRYSLRLPGLASSAEALEALARHLGVLPQHERADTEDAALPPSLVVRFRRGDDWQLGFVRSMSPTSVSIATGCPPRKGEVIDIEVRFEDLVVITPASVLAVTPPETAQLLGAFGFGARFAPADAASAATLARIQTIVGRDDTLVGRPPRRAHARFPVRWPIAVGVRGRSTRLAALDISERGMFVACDDFVARGTPTGITVPLDVEGEPVHAGAMVTRVLRGDAATLRAIPSGFGLELLSMSPADAGRYDDLVRRVAARSGKHVLVGADPRRLVELTSALRAVGYTASGASAPDALLAAASASPAPDLVIVDESMRGVRDRPTFLSFTGAATAIYRLADAALT